MPLTREIAIIASTRPASSLRSTVTYLLWRPAGLKASEKTARCRNAGTTPSAETKMIRKVTTDELRPVGAKEPSDPAQVRPPHRLVGGALDLLARREAA